MSVEKFGSSFLYKGNLGGGGEFREGDYSGGDKNQMLFRHNSVLCKENGCGVLAAGEALGSTLVHSLGEAKVSQLIFTKATALVFTDKATETRTVKHIQPHCHTKKHETEVSLSGLTIFY